ncbi:hypothetical protein [Oerskovia enterophila]|uniref:RecT family protein n=1 Tax=Oerskovia enterophila TaxID=43678 RepID=A0ABX2Y438_9CELL|nr:hypothetical protein [Oerskovia enterophila]OCI31072.1 hypothetical protein OERS_22830 [Oerskovia enterophila]
MTDLVTTTAALPLAEQWRFAETVSASSILPRPYRDDPGAVLVAVNLGAAMGLAPAESLYRIHVIEGKPSASAELIAANVRRAGHRLRVQGDDQSARAEIVRADDPDFVYTATWTIEKARAAGLSTKDVWKKYASAMLKARAITECARTACPEALYGVTYTEEEAREAAPAEPARRESAADVLASAVEPMPDAEPTITPDQLRTLHASFGEFGIATRDDGLAYASQVIGRIVGSTKELTKSEASAVIDNLKRDIANLPVAEVEPEADEVAS